MWLEYVLFYMCPDYAINKLSWWFPLIDLALILHRLISLETSNIRLKCIYPRWPHIAKNKQPFYFVAYILTYRRSREQFSLFWRHGTSGRNCKVVGNSSPVLDWGRRAHEKWTIWMCPETNLRVGCALLSTKAATVPGWWDHQTPMVPGIMVSSKSTIATGACPAKAEGPPTVAKLTAMPCVRITSIVPYDVPRRWSANKAGMPGQCTVPTAAVVCPALQTVLEAARILVLDLPPSNRSCIEQTHKWYQDAISIRWMIQLLPIVSSLLISHWKSIKIEIILCLCL